MNEHDQDEVRRERQEREQVEAIRRGDAEALGEFLIAKRRPLLAFIEGKLGAALRSRTEAEDILQEVSADAVRSLDDIDLSERDPFNWLCHLCERRVIDAARRMRADKRDIGRERPLQGGSSEAGLINFLVATWTSPSQAFARNSREQRLIDALAQLPELQQQALRMQYLEKLPSKEIAERIGKSDAAVRVMLSRAKAKLVELLSDLELD